MLITIRDRVTARIAAGQTLEQILQARPTDEFDERWAGTSWFGPEALVRVIHAELTAKPNR